MLRVTLLAVCLMAVVVLVACGDAEPEIQDVQTPAPTATPAPPTPTAAPTGSHTGVSEIDTVLDTVFTGDEDAVRALMQYTLVACVTEVSIDPGVRALCRDEEEEGALVEVFSEANCHGNHIRPEDTGEIVSTLSQPGGRLRAVASGRALGISAGDYVAVYDYISSARRDAAFAVMIADGKIVGMHGTCGMTADGFLEFNELDDLLLYNSETEPHTGISEIDAVLNAVFSGDEDAVEALIQYDQVACVTQPFGLGSPPQCREGEPEGTLSDFFAVGYCHGELVRPENMSGVIATLSRPGARLRAVSAVGEVWPAGDHVAVYDHVRGPEEQFDREVVLGGTNRIPHNALVLVLRDGAIVGVLSGCQGTPEEFLEGRNLDPLLFIPSGGLTGIRDLDIVLDGLTLNDADVLGAFIRFQGIACITTPEGIGAPPLCRSEEPLGERVEVFPLLTCEMEYRRRDQMDDVREDLAEAELYAVYEEGSRHVALMSWQTPSDRSAVRVVVEDRLIVEIDFTCSLTPEEALARVPADDILAGPLLP